MLSSINPLGERGRRNRWGVTAAWYVAASATGALLAGTALGFAGWWLQDLAGPPAWLLMAAVAVVALAGAAVDLGLGKMRLPTTRRQVNEDWLSRYRGWVYGAGFGFQLGLGVVTIVTTAAIYGAWLLAALSGSPFGGALIGLSFGLARSLILLRVRRATSPRTLRNTLARFQMWKPAAQRLAIGAQVTISTVAMTQVW